MSFATGGQWFWGNFGAANIGNEYAWQNPGGGFATPCNAWGYGGTGCNVGGGPGNRNNIFSLVGSSVTVGTIATGTFLWSPAAGLSSTTSNPVAASPMNTTTYTVVRTTPAGCQASAQITITVNKRPVVTTHPVNQVACGNTTATFTAAGTGTGLTYQWQESVNGCAGPWVNLPNTAPYSGVNGPILTINPVTPILSGRGYRVVLSGTCAPFTPPTNVSNCATLTVNPAPNVAITPVGPVCGGVACSFGTMLSVGSAPPPVPGQVTVSSGTVNLVVPDGVAAGTSNAITIAGVPANATITNISVALNMPHPYPHDMIIGLKGPSGQVLSLYKHNTNTTVFPPASIPSAGWFNAVVNKTSSTVFSTVPDPFRYGITAPAGPYRPDALNGVTSTGYTINDQTGFVSNAANFDALYTTPASINNSWTLALCDGGAGDVGTLVSWSMTIDYTTPGTGGGPVLTYVWSPQAGLYTDAAACIPYTGTNTPVVYAAPTTMTVYTVTATDVATGCINTSSVIVNYTPPPPTVVPASVTMCLGDPAVRLTSSSSSSSSSTVTASSGPISVPIPDGTGAAALSTLNIAGVPTGPGTVVSEVKLTMNINHTWVGDVDVNIQAPNNQILNLVGGLDGGAGGNASDNFTNTAFSSIGTTPISGAPAPRTDTYAAEARAGFGPTGYIQTVGTWAGLVPTPASANGTWRLAMADWVGSDAGTLTSWSIAVTTTTTTGVPATKATWSPIFGLWNDQALSQPYTGDARDTVWARPTPAGVYPYQVTIQSLPAYLPNPTSFTNPAAISIPIGGTGTPYPSNLTVSGVPAGATVNSVVLNGITHTWGEDVDVLLQSPTGQNVVLMSDVGGIAAFNATYTFADSGPAMSTTGANPTGTYKPTNNGATDDFPAPGPGNVTQAAPTLASLTGNFNGVWKLFALDDDPAGDQGSITGGYTVRFNTPLAPCTSPPRTVIVTVNQPTTVTTQPVNQTICTDKVATFSVVAAGTGPFTYQWQVSTNNGNTWTNVANGGVYSGATTSTLTITAPPVSMSGYMYRVVINGAAPCAPATSFQAVLTVNPLPVVVISAAPYTSIFPGLTTTLTSTVSPNAAAIYTWLRNGAAVPGASTGTLNVTVDGLGTYQLRVQDVNGCIGTSNTITIKDSASAKCFIYPNPTSGKFQVRYHSAANNILPRTLTVYDAKGDRVFTQLYSIGRPYDRMDVDMRAYGKGLYWVEIGDANGSRLSMCRVVIQ
jgi:subtilisin-like proprotein convertase family protein